MNDLFAPQQARPVFDAEMTEEQKFAASKIEDFLQSEHREFVLSGYAGTGKTFTIGRALAPHTFFSTTWVRGEPVTNASVVYVAPTHKATGVLEDALMSSGCEGDVMTIHSLLACRKVRNNGSMKFLPNQEKQTLHKYEIVVVDEASMIGREMRQWLLNAVARFPKIKIIWMGDPAQLPPVNDESIVFALDCASAKLETIMRNGGVVQQAATNVRLHIADIDTRYADAQSDDLGMIVRQDRDSFLSAYLERRQTAKILAWRNDAVDWINEWVRDQIYDDNQPFHIDERLVVVSSWGNHDETILLHSEDELVVHQLAEIRDANGIEYYHLTVGHERYASIKLEILHPESVAEYERQLEVLKAAALKDKKRWPDFYKLAERFVKVRPGWATTVHKSQGSTYDEVFVVETDLRGCKDHLTRNMLTYVAYSRAKRELWIA
jgi:exodeoxyribonuclease-5